MKRKISLTMALLCLLLTTVTVAAQSGGSYDLSWSTIDGGGGTSSGGSFTLDGTIGQPDASLMSAGTYILSGGFWNGSEVLIQFRTYLPVILK